MFLVDKYYNDSNYIVCHKSIINTLINSFDSHNYIYNNINLLEDLSNEDFYKVIEDLNYGTWRYSNFQHLIIYGSSGCGKEYLVNKLLENMFGKLGIELKEIEYTVSGYSNTKTKIMIKQSKHHIIIEPNSNGFDKYLIQEIIQEYAKSELLNIFKQNKLFKVVIINKIDNLSYYAQASLRRTMEKYSDKCKFILISEQLSKIIEPIRSRSLLVRVPLPTDEQILETLLYICEKENIDISFRKLNKIIKNSDNRINNAIWLLEMYKYDIVYEKNWDIVIDDIVSMILNQKLTNTKKLFSTMKKIRDKFYILFITNIPTQLIIRTIMKKILNKIDNLNYSVNDKLKLKYNIIDIISIYENRLNQGTRHIIHMEALISKLICLFSNYYLSKKII